MNTQLENSAPRVSKSASTLSRFPASKVEPSLLSRIQSALDSVVIVDSRQRIVLVNAQAERLFGYSAAQLLDKPLTVLMPPGAASRNAATCLDEFDPRDTRGATISLRAVRSNGKLLSLSVTPAHVLVDGEKYVALVVPANMTCKDTGLNTRPALPANLRRWAATSQQAAEIEKRRFSRKLYDDIGQRLSVLKLDLDWLENSLPGESNTVPARVARMQGLLDNVIAMTKNMASTLRPPLLDDFGLLPAVEWIVENLQKRTGISCSLESSGMEAGLDDTVQSALFRLVQEGLSNVEMHSSARNVQVHLHRLAAHMVVTIQDDGIGMTEGSENKPGCFGLIAMQERVLALGGTISIRNESPYGVTIQASIPIEPYFP